MVKVVAWPSMAAIGEKPEKVAAGATGVAGVPDTVMVCMPSHHPLFAAVSVLTVMTWLLAAPESVQTSVKPVAVRLVGVEQTPSGTVRIAVKGKF